MRKYVIVLFTILFTGPIALGQSNTNHFSKTNAIKIYPTNFARAEFRIGYEHYFKDRKNSISIVPSIVLKDTPDETLEGWQLMGQYRLYLSHLRADKDQTFWGLHNFGFYAGLYSLYFDYSEDYMRGDHDPVTNEYIMSRYHKDVSSIEGGALIGLQIDITKRFLIDFYVGGGIRYTDLEDSYIPPPNSWVEDYGVFDYEYQGVKPSIGLSLGMTF